ncbi:GNAT family N-acetyltransferase [Pseudomonas gingeri]|uniref:GNAT family N-acetyltransferase n=1 Tax=Pseudomonas gingeri TaxID=117681 RepID=UPI0034E97A2A
MGVCPLFSLRDGETVGWGGFETHGTDRLLRSMVVEPAYRSNGVGAEVLRVIEAIAAEQGIARFHLLTTTASGFFEQQGYAVNQRDSAPPLISQTEQFRGLCPGSASTPSVPRPAEVGQNQLPFLVLVMEARRLLRVFT